MASTVDDSSEQIAYERLPFVGDDDAKPNSTGQQILIGIQSFLVDISRQFEAAYNKLEAIAKCNRLFAFLSIVCIGQLAVFVLGVTKLEKCSASFELPQWLIMQAILCIVWHFVVNFMRNRAKLENVVVRSIDHCVFTLAIVGFAIFHLVVMFKGVVLSYTIFDHQLWDDRDLCDSAAYWSAFGIANCFLIGLGIFFLVFACRAMCCRANKKNYNGTV